jgi:hypothetical protein
MHAVLVPEVIIAANISALAPSATRSLSVLANNAGFISLTVDRRLLRFTDHNEGQ